MNRLKIMILFVLAIVNTVLTALGFILFAANTKGQTIPVFSIQIPVFLFGIGIVYIGIRYYLKLFRLYGKLSNPDLKFSWRNFKGGF